MSAAVSRKFRQQLAISPLRWVPHSSRISTATSVPPQSQRGENGSSKWSNLFLFIPGAITFGLGTWQIFRRQDKIKMLEYRQNRLETEPLIGNEILQSRGSLDALEFRRLRCKGVFEEKKSVYVGPRSRSISGVTENGYYVITPLFPVSGDAESTPTPILVNRGWVPRSWRDNESNASQNNTKEDNSPAFVQKNTKVSWWNFWSKNTEASESSQDNVPANNSITVSGVIRDSEKPSIFVPANDPNASQWFYVDVPAIARACGLPEDTLYIEDINDNVNPCSPYPIPKDANSLIRSSVMPQDHLNYTLTWYSLSAAVTFMAIKRLQQRRR